MKKRIIAALLSLVMLLGVVSPVLALGYGEEWQGYTEEVRQQYSDVAPTHWAFQSIDTCSQRSWFNGYPDGSFRPTALITREEAAKVFAVAMGLQLETDPTPSFVDTANCWAKAYIEATKSLFPNVANLQGTSSFRPTQTITREETIYALVIALGFRSKTVNADLSVLNMFSDASSISAAVKPYMAVAVSEGLAAGMPDGTINAQKGLSRAEFATLLARAINHGLGNTADEFQAPVITLDRYPSSTTEETVTVTGKVSPASDVKLSLDGEPVYLSHGGAFELDLKLEKAQNQFTLIAENFYGAKVQKDISIDLLKPEIDLDDYETSTAEERMTISGHLSPVSAKLYLDGEQVSVNSRSGSFQLPLELKAGKNTFTLTAENGAGMLTKTSIVVERTLLDVDIRILTSIPSETSSNSLSVSGVIENYSDDCVLLCNDSRVQVDAGGYFSLTLDLNPGQNTFTLSVLRGGKDAAKAVISILRLVAEGAGEWLEELPDDVTSEYYNIEEKAQYRSKNRATQVSSYTSIDGWTLIKEDGSWGPWSDWLDKLPDFSISPNSANKRSTESRQVQTAPARTEYRYGRWYDSKAKWAHYCPAFGKAKTGNTYSLDYTAWSTSQYTRSHTNYEACWHNGEAGHNHVGQKSNHYWDRWVINGGAYYWEETRTVAATYKTQYRYRDYTAANTFERWSDWSDWMDGSISADSDTQVETRTVYRFTPRG